MGEKGEGVIPDLRVLLGCAVFYYDMFMMHVACVCMCARKEYLFCSFIS